MSQSARKIAQYLLQIKAIQLQPSQPFTWASGWQSPIYCDNRKVLSYPIIRSFVVDSFCKLIEQQYPYAETIAGVATAGIAHSALIAWHANLPMIYVRSKPKGHGMQNLIEGDLLKGQKVVVVEDLISTGKSTLAAVAALRAAGAEVLGAVAIFSYGFDHALQNFEKNDCPFQTLCDYDTLIDEAIRHEYVNKDHLSALQAWRKNPADWSIA